MKLILASSSSIIGDIERDCATGLASIVYYYFDYKDSEKQDCHGLLSSLLTQLCAQSHHGFDILSSLYETHLNGVRKPRVVDLIKCLKKVLAFPGQGMVYIIVDALDESSNKNDPGIPSQREKVLQVMKDLIHLRHDGADIRICITSRPEVDIRTDLDLLASHSVSLHDEEGQRRDIISYIKFFVESNANMQRWRAEDRQLVIDELSKKADGM